MDPSLIESHTGMKVLPKEEFDLLSTQLESARSEIREMNAKTQEKFKAVLQADSEVKMMKEGIEELKKFIAIKGEEAKASAEEEKKEEAAAPVVEEKKEEAAAAPAEEVAVPVEEEKKE